MEREIVVGACDGDASAFAAIVEEFTPTVLAAAYGLCGDRHLAADIAQEVFATAYVKIPTLRDPAALPGWLMAITRSSARVARPRRVAVPVDAVTPGVDDQVVAADEARRIRRAVEALPTAERLPMALHYFAGCRLADIAELCGLPLSTVKKRMRTAREHIRQQGSEMDMDNLTLVSDETRSNPSDVVRMFSAMRTGDTGLVAAILDSRPDLVDVREDWTLEESRRHRLPWTSGGGTPLLRAVERGDTTMVELLLSRGADPDAACGCEGGENPVWVAAAQRDDKVLEALLAHGADPNRPAFAGLTPLDVATVRGYDDIVAQLRCAGGQPSTYRAFDAAQPQSAATGIKTIDLWCPLPQHGLVHLAPGYGLGAIVLLNELSRRAAITGQRVVWTGFVPSPLDLGDMHHAVAESGIADRVTLALASPTAPDKEQTAALDAGITAAKDGGLLIVFNETGHLLAVDQRLMELADRPGTTIVVAPLQAASEPPHYGSRPYLASIAFDKQRAARGRWPAISSESWSLVATPQMATLAEQARLAMTDELDEYLSQPFHVAEHILGVAGETVEPDELHSEVSKRIATAVSHDVPVEIRRAHGADAGAVADVWIRSRSASIPQIPPPAHSDDDVHDFFERVVLLEHEVWVAEANGGVVALLVLDGDWIEQLYVDPEHYGNGIGSKLIAIAKRERPDGLRLWTFETNSSARRFYERHAFVATGSTPGDNEEGVPDIRYEWQP